MIETPKYVPPHPLPHEVEPTEEVLAPSTELSVSSESLDELFAAEVETASGMIRAAAEDGRLVIDLTPREKVVESIGTLASSHASPESSQNDRPKSWSPENMDSALRVARSRANDLRSMVRHRYFIPETDIDDVLAAAETKLFLYMKRGLLPEDVARDEEAIQKAITTHVKRAAVDQIRHIRGRHGGKPLQDLLDNQLSEDGETSFVDLLEDPAAQEEFSSIELLDEAKRLLPSLTPHERQTVILKGYFGLSASDIARISGVSHSAISRRLENIHRKSSLLTID